MTSLYRICLLLIFILLIRLQMGQAMHDLAIGHQMNDKMPPHKAIGLFFAAYQIQNHREDWARDYYTSWMQARYMDKSMVEVERGVVPLSIIRASLKFPYDPSLRDLREMVRAKKD